MKTLIIENQLRVLSLFFGLLLVSFPHAKAESNLNSGVSFQVFYDALSPYGDWIKDARYGYVWVPAVYEDFHPYGTNGHWVMTGFGNTWISDYDWGWATFHYGRWYFDDYYQNWAWIPGYEWAPAWVSWRSGDGFYGWAPLGPGLFINNLVMNIPSRHWVFIPYGRIYQRNLYSYYTPYAHHRTKIKIINRTTVINTTVVYNNHNYYSGPSHRELERVTRQVVPVYALRSSEAPGREAISSNEVRMYRPEIEQSRGRTQEARPSRFLESNEAKTARSFSNDGSSGYGNSGQLRSSANGQNNPSDRLANPSGTRRNEGFEWGTASSNTRSRSEMAQPSRSVQHSSRESIRNSQPTPAGESRVRPQFQPSREYQVRTQPSPRLQTEKRNSTPSRGSEMRQQTLPQVRTGTSRGSESGVSSPSRQSGSPRVQSSAPSRVNPSGRAESATPSRGNSSERNNR